MKRLDHVQVCIPVGMEEEARRFYSDILGLSEIPKPDSLVANGGLWYKAGDVELHIGVEKGAGHKSKRHPAFEVENIHEARRYLMEKGVPTQDEKPIPNVSRFSFFDPFENRLEFLQKESGSKDMNTTKQAVTAQFSRSAEAYVQSEGHAKGKDLSKLVEIAEVTPLDWVVDVATGGGHVANALAPLVKKVTAYDLTEDMLQAAKRFLDKNGHHNVGYVQGDAERMPFEDERVDVVTCRIAPHHFPHLDRFVAESYRVLKQGGTFLLVDNVAPEDEQMDRFYNEVEERRDYSHHRAWKKSEWLQMLEKQGFEIEEWYSFSKTFPFDSWCDRMHLAKEEKKALNTFMLQASKKLHHKFRIKVEDHQIVSFQGESILLKARKN